ncbi:TadE/TadG family type IV pilus assembly protein [Salinarimonas sp.]|uniref:TadE/TadG family type IV pilus assembly protein n=1 Tax=Salinarimonas sp. TaxID=2766526 RepID=UPI0039198D22
MFGFGKDRKGNVAIVFALSILPVLATTGAAVDFGRAGNAREFMQVIGDRTVVAVAAADVDRAASSLASAKQAIFAHFGDDISDVRVSGRWLDDRHFAVTVEGRLAMRMVQAVPGMPQNMSIAVESIGRRIPPTYRVLPPRRMLLEPEAADYNRIYIYCFDPSRIHEADRGRSQLTPLADNGTPPTDFERTVPGWRLPICGPGEVPSYKLRNVRSARSNPAAWDDPRREVYEYFTDSSFVPGTDRLVHTIRGARVFADGRRDQIDMSNKPILETVLCRTDEECRNVSQGGIIPNRQTNRDPRVATGECHPGMLMYFGWEDRPPGLGWTDRDYDDIRLVVSCPEQEKLTDKQVTIVR